MPNIQAIIYYQVTTIKLSEIASTTSFRMQGADRQQTNKIQLVVFAMYLFRQLQGPFCHCESVIVKNRLQRYLVGGLMQ